jgi:hypothetical protein
MILIGSCHGSFVFFSFLHRFCCPKLTDNQTKPKKQPKTNPAKQTYHTFSGRKTATKSKTKTKPKRQDKICPRKPEEFTADIENVLMLPL